MKRYTIVLLLCLVLRIQGEQPEGPGDTPGASNIVKATVERYRSTQAVVVHADFTRVQQHGATESGHARRVRLLAAAGSTRLDIYGEKQHSQVVLERDGTVTLCFLPSPGCIDAPVNEQSASPALDALRESAFSWFGWIATLDLDSVNAELKGREQLKSGKQRFDCYRLSLRPKSGNAWTAQLWVEKGTFLVRRASVRKTVGGAIVFEEAQFPEVLMDTQVPVDELRWAPPASTPRLTRWPAIVPH